MELLNEEVLQIIHSASNEIEQTRTLPKDVLQVAYEEQVFKLFLPESLGGLGLSLPEAALAFQETATADGSFGWLTTIGSGGNMFLENMTENQAKELFSPTDAVIAGSGYATGVAQAVDGGYQVTGEWRYCSGAPYATMFTANTIIHRNGEASEEMRACIFMPEQVEIIEDWDAFGLQGTGSHTIRVRDVFVPENRTFSVMEKQNSLGSPVHSLPFVQFSQVSFASVCLGIGARFLEETTQFAKNMKTRWNTEKMDAFMQELTAQQANFDTIEQRFHETVETFWSLHLDGDVSDQKLLEVSAVCIESANVATETSVRLFRQLGMHGVMKSSPINRAFRDLWTAGQHGFLQA